MTPLGLLKAAVAVFEKRGAAYCLIGGHAASLYRSQERLTRDVDFALVAEPISNSRKLAEEVISELGLTPMLGFIARSDTSSSRPVVCMVTSTPPPKEQKGLIDILLPDLPWVISAVERAQHNCMDLGFAKVPVITPEDLVIAKSFALADSPERFQDLDDLKEIFKAVKDLDQDYIRAAFAKFSLGIPQVLRKYAPVRLV